MRFSSPITVPMRSRAGAPSLADLGGRLLEVQPGGVDRLDDAVVEVAADALPLAEEELPPPGIREGSIGLLLEQLEADDDRDRDREPGRGDEDLDRDAEGLEHDLVVQDRSQGERRLHRHQPSDDGEHDERERGRFEGDGHAATRHRRELASRAPQCDGHEQRRRKRDQVAGDDVADGEGRSDVRQGVADLRRRQPRPDLRNEALGRPWSKGRSVATTHITRQAAGTKRSKGWPRNVATGRSGSRVASHSSTPNWKRSAKLNGFISS